jgi:hypothetical protein
VSFGVDTENSIDYLGGYCNGLLQKKELDVIQLFVAYNRFGELMG